MRIESPSDERRRSGGWVGCIRLAVAAAAVFCFLGRASGAAPEEGAKSKSRAATEAERIVNAVEEPSIVFSCDQVEVRTFVKMIGTSLGHKFIVDESVKGKVTVVAPKIR